MDAFEDLAELAVHANPDRRRELLVDGLANQRMAERVAARRLGGLHDDPRANCLVQQLQQRVRTLGGEALQDRHAELGPDHRGEGEHAIAGLGQSIESAPHDVAQTLGQRRVPGTAGRLVVQRPLGAQQTNRLPQNEGIALGDLRHGLDEGLVGGRAHHRLEEVRDLVVVEAAQCDALGVGLAGDLAEHGAQRVASPHLHLPVAGDEEECAVLHLPRQELEQQAGGLVGPVEIVDQDDEGLVRATPTQVARDALEEPEARLVGARGQLRRGRAEPLGQLRNEMRDGVRVVAHLVGQVGVRNLLDHRAQHLHPGPEGRNTLALVAAPLDDVEAAPPRKLAQLLGGSRLPDAGLAEQQHHPPASRGRVGQGRFEMLEGALATDEDLGGGIRRLALRRHLGLGAPALFHPRHELIAASVHRPDEGLATSVVADRLASRCHRARDRRIGHVLAGPERVEELGLGDDALAVRHQVAQHVEDLGLELHHLAASAQLEGGLVQLVALEGEDHDPRRIADRASAREAEPRLRGPKNPSVSGWLGMRRNSEGFRWRAGVQLASATSLVRHRPALRLRLIDGRPGEDGPEEARAVGEELLGLHPPEVARRHHLLDGGRREVQPEAHAVAHQVEGGDGAQDEDRHQGDRALAMLGGCVDERAREPELENQQRGNGDLRGEVVVDPHAVPRHEEEPRDGAPAPERIRDAIAPASGGSGAQLFRTVFDIDRIIGRGAG